MIRIHKHEWRRISAQAYSSFEIWNGEKVPQGKWTLVLLRCNKCGKCKTERIKGKWTLEELNIS